ncbi:amino acid ABC transporter permease [Pseudomonas vancouverensis]|uniref:Amino acid ABC transporter permease n=1 Tax=Pseudomonas vancouverensis TaxID=95300 RepID=A0A1H2PD86_PSEVA|nr:amino acid ABC transporter permease [Pseudomonas vancouverensis]KAB0493735.1 amino acid ABC transporter permease [Pseudomonas vancouverensis]TDB67688.1 amino acid ABC transporter permease [Pseudomonas vancouverensis]SDV15265.1 amino acid ABC transporter membrane protein 1, PAAT family [Pseudomonas vancouverensis]
MDLTLIQRTFPFFLEAAWITVQISVLALLLGLLVAIVLVAARLSTSLVLRCLARIYISVFRGTPCLVQLFIIYFGGPQIGLELEPFAAGVLGLGLNIAAYMAESIRGAISNVDPGQEEAARSIGFGRGQTFWFITLPQAAKLMIRPLGVNAVALVKGSALVSTISVVELSYTAQRFISSTYKPFEMFVVSALLYIVMVYLVRFIVDRLDNRFAAR